MQSYSEVANAACFALLSAYMAAPGHIVILKAGTLLHLRAHTSLALFLDEAAKLFHDVSDQARLLS
jgi:hypothetical protein